jgi:hypothetical protein
MNPTVVRQINATIMDLGQLPIWTVYDHPSDYPNSYVARMFAIASNKVQATDRVIVAAELEYLRKLLRETGLTCMARASADDPKIIECWV